MIKKLLAIGALALAFPAQAAVTISYTGGVSALPAGLTVIQDFNSLAVGAPLGPFASVFGPAGAPNAATPAFNSSGNFGAVLGGGTYNVSFAPASIFSFVLGSLDTYNKLTLSFASGGPLVLSGAQIALGATANGNQSLAVSNGRVTYSVGALDPLITGATFQSTTDSMEFDDLATLAVPEPSTWLMMLMGFAAVGFSIRRKQNLRVSFA